ncbi:hypothetical protein G6F57_022738 [Rhizopus arrhizus]|nr:hypothetical protein G6F57_022738 [Rhizopus arrhizus]
MWTSRGMRWWCSLAYRGRESRRWPSARCRRARRGRDRRLASRRGAATAARHGKRAFHGRQRHHPVQHVAHAVFAGRHVSGTPADAVRRGFLAQHAAGGVPQLPWAGLRVRRDREIHGA